MAAPNEVIVLDGADDSSDKGKVIVLDDKDKEIAELRRQLREAKKQIEGKKEAEVIDLVSDEEGEEAKAHEVRKGAPLPAGKPPASSAAGAVQLPAQERGPVVLNAQGLRGILKKAEEEAAGSSGPSQEAHRPLSVGNLASVKKAPAALLPTAPSAAA